MAEQQAMENFLELIDMRHAVRFGEQPDSPGFLTRWLELEEITFPRVCNCIKRRVYRREYDLLMDAITDELVPETWRQLCLDHIHHPLNGLSAVASKPHHRKAVNRLRWEMNTLAGYFLQYS